MSGKKKIVLQYVILTLCMALAGAAQAFSIKGNIGVFACWDAVSMNVYELTGFKVGYFSMSANTICVIAQFLILRKEFRPIRILQIPFAVLYGTVINLVYYHFLTFDVNAYWIKAVFLIIAILGLAIFIGAVTMMNLIQIPVEGTCYIVSSKYAWDFAKIRIAFDAVCMVISVVMSLIFGLSFKIREGTIISMLLVGPLMKWCMKLEKPWIGKLME